MACALAHRVVAGTSIGIAMAYKEAASAKSTAWPIAGGALGAVFGTLPDIIEPAANPNHRQFFHSFTFAGVLVYSAYKIHSWEPEEGWKGAVRTVGLIAIGAYLVHLAMDATTPKSLPLIGQL